VPRGFLDHVEHDPAHRDSFAGADRAHRQIVQVVGRGDRPTALAPALEVRQQLSHWLVDGDPELAIGIVIGPGRAIGLCVEL
jgi:hypothetical protein